MPLIFQLLLEQHDIMPPFRGLTPTNTFRECIESTQVIVNCLKQLNGKKIAEVLSKHSHWNHTHCKVHER